MPKILIADDHELLIRGVRDILEEAFSDLTIGHASDGREVLEAVNRQKWDLVLLDINMPGRSGLEILQELKQLQPELPVVILSMLPEKDFAVRAFKLGAVGYVSKQSASSELLVAARKALAGGRYITPALAESMAAFLAGGASLAAHELLSDREMQVLRLVAAGRTIKEIAAELKLSEKTIGTYRSRISQKLHLSTNVELALYATRHKLVE
jgi:two-component system, NarL family, invasion response regulator UvrY